MMNFDESSDEEIVKIWHEGVEDAMDYLLNKYKNIVRKRARAMFIIGGDTDDLIQEGMIGLYKAVSNYDEKKEASFQSFAELCISRQIYTAINNSNRKKHGPLNSYISLYSEEYDEIQGMNNNPENILIDRENVKMIESQLNKELSNYERQVLEFYVGGKGYIEIASILEKPPKSVDNTIQRIKAKAAKVLEGISGE